MHRIALTGLLIVVALLGLSRPSGAAVTASLSIVGSTPISAKCPVNVQFTGTIAGTPGTVLTYSFNRYVNGVQNVVNGGTMTVPVSGSIAVADTLPISVSTSGSTFDQVWVHNISGGLPDVYSNKVNFTVNCQSGGITGSSMQVMQAPPGGWPPTPTGLLNTNDINVCSSHLPKIFCQAALSSGQTAFIWDWSGNATYPSLDGYKLYTTNNGIPKLVMTTSAGDGPKGTFLAAPSDGFNGKCYIVMGYVGTIESHGSNQVCLGTSATAKTVTLQVVHVRSAEVTSKGTDNYPGQLDVGWWQWKDVSSGYVFWRAGVWFDVKSLAPSSIIKATLHLHRASSPGVPTQANCVAQVAAGSMQWWNTTGAINGWFNAAVVEPPAAYGQNLDIDVTPLAKNWVGMDNNGLVLRGSDESKPDNPQNISCWNPFGSNPTLEVTYS